MIVHVKTNLYINPNTRTNTGNLCIMGSTLHDGAKKTGPRRKKGKKVKKCANRPLPTYGAVHTIAKILLGYGGDTHQSERKKIDAERSKENAEVPDSNNMCISFNCTRDIIQAKNKIKKRIIYAP